MDASCLRYMPVGQYFRPHIGLVFSATGLLTHLLCHGLPPKPVSVSLLVWVCLQEKPLLERIQVACEDLLARCLENYYSLSENAPSGISENGMDTSEQPAPALMEAVLLCSE